MIVVQLRLSGPSENAISQELVLVGFTEDVLEPALDIVEMFHGDRVYMYGCPMEILEDHDKIKVFQPKLLLALNIKEVPGHVQDVRLRRRQA
jgi:hypothetical protein